MAVRRKANVDTNQREIVEALRGAGAIVQHLHFVGQGCPDLLCGYRGKTHLLEVKSGAKDRLTPDEAEWHASWRGRPVEIVRTPEEALRVIGAAVQLGFAADQAVRQLA